MARRDFATTANNNAAKPISADWVNALDTVLDRGLAVTPHDFAEGVGTGNGNDTSAFTQAVAYLNTNAVNATANEKGSSRLFIPAGEYDLEQTVDVTHNLIIEGEGHGVFSAATKINLHGCTGFRFQRYNTSGAGTVDGVTHMGADGSTIRNLYLLGDYQDTPSDAEYHGIHAKARIKIDDCLIEWCRGDGIHISATGGAPDPADEGNANGFRILSGRARANRNNVFIAGADANAGLVIGVDTASSRQFCFNDQSTLGNTYVMCQTELGGLFGGATPTMVSDGTYRYGVIAGQETWCSTHAPSGTTADNQGWYYHSTGAASPGLNINLWVSGTTYQAGGSFRAVNPNQRGEFFGCYAEGGQANPQIVMPNKVWGGTLADYRMIAPPGNTAAGGFRSSTSYMEAIGSLQVDGFVNAVGGGIYRDGVQLLGAQQTGCPAAATDLASAITLVNYLRTKGLLHGFIAT